MNTDTYAVRRRAADRYFSAMQRALAPLRVTEASHELDVACVADCWLTLEGLPARMLWRVRGASSAERFGRQVLTLREHEVQVLLSGWLKPDLVFSGVAAASGDELVWWMLFDGHHLAQWLITEGIREPGRSRSHSCRWCEGDGFFLVVDLSRMNEARLRAMTWRTAAELLTQHQAFMRHRHKTPCSRRSPWQYRQLKLI